MVNEELVKFLILMPFLLVATHSDMKSMTVSNKLLKCLLFVIVVVSLFNINQLPNVIMHTILIFLIMVAMFTFGLIGGADGKILTLVAMLFPSFEELRTIFPFTIMEMITGFNSNVDAFVSLKIPFALIVFVNSSFISGITFIFLFRKLKLNELVSKSTQLKVPFLPFLTGGFIVSWLLVNKSLFGG